MNIDIPTATAAEWRKSLKAIMADGCIQIRNIALPAYCARSGLSAEKTRMVLRISDLCHDFPDKLNIEDDVKFMERLSPDLTLNLLLEIDNPGEYQALFGRIHLIRHLPEGVRQEMEKLSEAKDREKARREHEAYLRSRRANPLTRMIDLFSELGKIPRRA